jgi:hypothetical protein
MNGFSAAHRRLTCQVNLHFTQLEFRRRFAVSLHASQQRPHAGQQFLGAEWLDQVIVRAGIQTGHAVFHLAFGGEHEHRHGIGQPAQFRADFVAVELRHHDVEQDQVRLLFEGAFQAALAIRRRQRAIALRFEHVFEGRAHRRFVFDD